VEAQDLLRSRPALVKRALQDAGERDECASAVGLCRACLGRLGGSIEYEERVDLAVSVVKLARLILKRQIQVMGSVETPVCDAQVG
jgi:hypothetical protein